MTGLSRTPVRIGVDIGGTFTDVVVVDAAGGVHVSKAPSNPADPAAGALRALTVAAGRLGCEIGQLLAACTLFVHGSTIATNTLLEKKGARVGLLTTQGFRDSLEVRRSFRKNAWDHRTAYPPVLVPRYLRLPVPGRLDSMGRELSRLDLEAIRSAVTTFRREGVESVAICLLHSYANSAHEHQARDFLRELWPDAWVYCSADIAPIMGEYERTSTVVVNAYVAPRVVPYLRALEEKLATLGLPGGLLLVQSNGGTISTRELAERPVQVILSGPAAAVSAIRVFGKDTGNDSLVSIEVGGTSCDVMLSIDGVAAVSEQIEVDGYHVVVPAVEIHTIGAGGGTIASVDNGGLLHAGPAGAGARPGPAAYGLGGERPTVTDAQLVLGRLKPGPYAGGGFTLDLEKAQAAISSQVAVPLGIGVHEAAAGILRLVEQNMLHAVEQVSIERGHDPQRFTLVAAGGAGPLHGVPVARALRCRSVFVPRLAGVFCAYGMCNADMRHDYTRAYLRDLDEPDSEAAMSEVLSALQSHAEAVLEREGFAKPRRLFRKQLDLRYLGQQWTVRVETESLDPARVRGVFEAEHKRLYGYTQPGGRIDVVNVQLTGVGLTGAVFEAQTPSSPPAAPAMPRGKRNVWIDERHGIMQAEIFTGAALHPGAQVVGPAIVEEDTTTVLVGVGDVLRVSRSGNYLIELR
jgi:N-methylhydantoinase A